MGLPKGRADVRDILDLGLAAHQAGRWADADRLYRSAIEQDPGNAGAWHLLGVLHGQRGDTRSALQFFERAQSLAPSALYCVNAAEACAVLGRHQQAADYARQAIALDPAEPDGYLQWGHALLVQGRPQDARTSLAHALKLDPRHSRAWLAVGNAWQAEGRWDEAIAAWKTAVEHDPLLVAGYLCLSAYYESQQQYEAATPYARRAIEADPASAEAHTALARVLHAEEKIEDAVVHYRRALELKPDHLDALANIGAAYQALGQLDLARVSYLQALELKADAADVHLNLATVLTLQGRDDEAYEHLEQAAALAPVSADFYDSLGAAWHDLGDHYRAADAYRHLLTIEPKRPSGHLNLGVALRDAGLFEEAEQSFRQALDLDPESPDALNNLGACLRDLGRYDESIAYLLEALQRDPEHLKALNNLGAVMQESGDLEQSAAYLEQALAKDPQYAEAHWNRAINWLLQGDFDRGWREYAWRWRRTSTPPRPFDEPEWKGEPMPRAGVLLYAEQGMGDVLEWIRYAPLVRRRVGRVIVECHEPLVRLLARSPGVDWVVAFEDDVPEFHAQAPLDALPMLFHELGEPIPAKVPYLVPPPVLVESWQRKLAAVRALKVGIAWQGNPRHHRDRARSIPPEHFWPLADVPGVQLYNLQMGAGHEALDELSDPERVIDLTNQVSDFADSAALVSQLDLVICCDSAPAHLAGALGIDVWLALAASPDWRWMLERTDSPWYPTMHLFRQAAQGDWQGVFARIRESLSRRAARHVASGGSR